MYSQQLEQILDRIAALDPATDVAERLVDCAHSLLQFGRLSSENSLLDRIRASRLQTSVSFTFALTQIARITERAEPNTVDSMVAFSRDSTRAAIEVDETVRYLMTVVELQRTFASNAAVHRLIELQQVERRNIPPKLLQDVSWVLDRHRELTTAYADLKRGQLEVRAGLIDQLIRDLELSHDDAQVRARLEAELAGSWVQISRHSKTTPSALKSIVNTLTPRAARKVWSGTYCTGWVNGRRLVLDVSWVPPDGNAPILESAIVLEIVSDHHKD